LTDRSRRAVDGDRISATSSASSRLRVPFSGSRSRNDDVRHQHVPVVDDEVHRAEQHPLLSDRVHQREEQPPDDLLVAHGGRSRLEQRAVDELHPEILGEAVVVRPRESQPGLRHALHCSTPMTIT